MKRVSDSTFSSNTTSASSSAHCGRAARGVVDLHRDRRTNGDRLLGRQAGERGDPDDRWPWREGRPVAPDDGRFLSAVVGGAVVRGTVVVGGSVVVGGTVVVVLVDGNDVDATDVDPVDVDAMDVDAMDVDGVDVGRGGPRAHPPLHAASTSANAPGRSRRITGSTGGARSARRDVGRGFEGRRRIVRSSPRTGRCRVATSRRWPRPRSRATRSRAWRGTAARAP